MIVKARSGAGLKGFLENWDVAVLEDGASAPPRPVVDSSWTCEVCGRIWYHTKSCPSCSPEGAWKWTEKGVEIKPNTTLEKGVMEELLNRRPSP